MDPADYSSMVRPAVGIPTIVCLWYLVQLWRHGELYGAKLRAFVLWFAAALALQLASLSTWVWIAGFLGQVALAITLVLKRQRDDFL